MHDGPGGAEMPTISAARTVLLHKAFNELGQHGMMMPSASMSSATVMKMKMKAAGRGLRLQQPAVFLGVVEFQVRRGQP